MNLLRWGMVWGAVMCGQLVLPLCAQAQQVGETIVTISDATLKSGSQIVGTIYEGNVLRVQNVEGDWFWVSSSANDTGQTISGWVSRQEILPVAEALDHFSQKLREQPTARRYNIRGGLWSEKGESDKAIADYNEAIRLDPNYGRAYFNRGNTWHSKQEYDKAIGDYNEAIRLDPKYRRAYTNRGNAWNSKQEYDKAIADCSESIRLDPKDSYAYNNRGNAWKNKREYDNAIADYSEAIRIDPEFAFAFFNRGNAWKNKKEYDKAIADYNEAIRYDPNDAFAYYNRGRVWNRKQEYDKAIADYNEVIRLDPKYADPYGSLAWLRATCLVDQYRNGKQAVELATRACEFSRYKNAYHLVVLAAAYAENGEFAEAVRWQTKALELAPRKEQSAFQSRLDLYKADTPYREEPGK